MTYSRGTITVHWETPHKKIRDKEKYHYKGYIHQQRKCRPSQFTNCTYYIPNKTQRKPTGHHNYCLRRLHHCWRQIQVCAIGLQRMPLHVLAMSALACLAVEHYIMQHTDRIHLTRCRAKKV